MGINEDKESREKYLEGVIEYVMNYLKENNINIDDINNREDDIYKKVMNSTIFMSESFMSIEEIAINYILTDEKKKNLYKSKYEMGNTVQLSEKDCRYTSLAEDIMDNGQFDTNYLNANDFNKKNGLKDRIKNGIHFDLDKYKDPIWDESKYQIYKILYLFYKLEHIEFKGTNVINVLSKPTMENVDNLFLGLETTYGTIINRLKSSLRKELKSDQFELEKTINDIVQDWHNIICISTMFLGVGEKDSFYDLDSVLNRLEDISKCLEIERIPSQYTIPPIECLYLKILQHESLGIWMKLHDMHI